MIEIEEIKYFLQIKDNSKDTIIPIWEIEGIEYIKSIIGDFEVTNKKKNLFTKNGKIFLNGLNLQITKVEKNVGNFDNPSYENIENYRFSNGCLYLPNNGEYRVSYTVGYNDIPNDIKTAIKLFIGEKFSFNSGKIKRETVDGDSIEFVLDNSSQSTILSLISKYKTYDFSA